MRGLGTAGAKALERRPITPKDRRQKVKFRTSRGRREVHPSPPIQSAIVRNCASETHARAGNVFLFLKTHS
jgi:hypothetical protein